MLSTDIILRSDVNGACPARAWPSASSGAPSSLRAATRKAASVGSPWICQVPSRCVSCASLATDPATRARRASSRVRSTSPSTVTSPTGAYPVPPSTTLPEAVTTSRSVISLRVRVPVLSEQITDTEPSVSTEWRSFITALRRASACTPIARTSERMAGSPSGTAATASDTPMRRMSTAPSSVLTWVTRAVVTMTTIAMATTRIPSVVEMRAISRWRGLGSDSVSSSSVAMRPISVRMPVSVTTARPTPRATAVPLNTMLLRSASGAGPVSGPGDFPAASDSPVSEASCTRSAVALRSRASAPTASPSASTRTSPGTSSVDATVLSCPPRRTVDRVAVRSANAATARSARFSWMKPMTALATTISEITTASTGTPPPPSTAHAITEMTIAARRR